MSDDEYDDDPDPQTESRDLRNLRDKAKRADKLEAQLAEQTAQLSALTRDNAFRQAGIDPSDSKAKYFAKAYDGDLTLDAIRAEAESAGLLDSRPSPVADEVARADRMAGAAAGGETQGTPTHWDELNALGHRPSPEEIQMILMKHGQPTSSDGPIGEFESIVRS